MSGLQLRDDPAFLRRSWAGERIGWVFLGLLLAAGILGLLGPGWLSRATAEGPLRVRYDRFGRLDGEAELQIRLAPPDRSLWIENRWLDGVRIEGVRPPPASARSAQDWTVFTFDGAEGVDVRLDILHRRAGALEGRFGASAERSVLVRQLVYP